MAEDGDTSMGEVARVLIDVGLEGVEAVTTEGCLMKIPCARTKDDIVQKLLEIGKEAARLGI